QSVTASVTPSDADGDKVILVYKWFVGNSTNPVRISPATDATSDSLTLAGNAVKGNTVKVEVTPYDGTLFGTPQPASFTVADAPPVAAQNITQSVSHRDMAPVSIPLSGTDPDGDSLTFSLVGTNGGASHGTVTLNVTSSGTFAVYTPTGTFI